MFAKKLDPLRSVALPPPAAPAPEIALAGYAARRSYAFELAEDAYWQGAICADAYMLFRLLTRLCKERTFCWPGLDYLAERLHTSIGTIKRRLDELERADLIERRQRAGGLTSYTFVRPLQAFDAPAPRQEQSAAPVTKMPAPEAVFFVPEQRITGDSRAGSALIPHTVKSQNKNPGGGGEETSGESKRTAAAELLAESGVSSPAVLDELQHAPLAEVQACLSFARKQRNVLDPAAFGVALLRLGQGAKLVERGARQGTPARTEQRSQPIARPGDPAGYGHFHCEHGRVRGAGCPECLQPAIPPSVRAAPEQPLEEHPGIFKGACAEAHIWATTLAGLRQTLGSAVADTWLGAACLLLVGAERVVVGTPNVFVREQLTGPYAAPLAQALAEALSRAVAVEVVVDTR